MKKRFLAAAVMAATMLTSMVASAAGQTIYVLGPTPDHGWTAQAGVYAEQKVEEINAEGKYKAVYMPASSGEEQVDQAQTIIANGDAAGAADFCKWVEDVLVDVINMTREKMEKYYDEHVTDTMCKNELYKKYYMDTIIEDTSAVTGLEMIRRIVGMANVKDITTIADEAKRARAEKICITAAIDFIKNRSDKKCGKCFLKTLTDAIAEVDA